MIDKKPNCIELESDESVFVRDLSISKEISCRDEKLVAIFGGGGIPRESFYYQKAMEFAKNIASSGISVITGGGPGIMEAGNRGAKSSESLSNSYGLKVSAIKDEDLGDITYLDPNCDFTFDTLAVRLLTLIANSNAIVFFPGGYGTFEELFSLLVRIKVDMMKGVPIYLFGSKFWGGLISWLSEVVKNEGTIGDEHLSLFRVEDDIEKISQEIISHFVPLN